MVGYDHCDTNAEETSCTRSSRLRHERAMSKNANGVAQVCTTGATCGPRCEVEA